MENGTKPFNICDTLRKRLQEINDLKEATQTQINSKSEQLQKLFGKGIKSSRTTPAQLDAKIDELETKRTSTSLPLSEEKDILRQIAQIKKAKVQYEETKAHEKIIQDKKAEVNSLRTDLTKYKAQIAELEAALSKVELADRLGCTANDLTSHKMDCPVDKLGQVIGKGGSNIKKLENKTGCIVDIDKVHSQIHLQGNESSIKKAITEIENIILAIEVEMTMGEALFTFLFNKQLAEFSALQKKHPNVIFDLSKETRLLKLRGKEEYVAPAKEDVMSVDVKMEKIQIPSREAAVIVGKGGKTINRLVADHDVSIQVENQKETKSNSDKSTIIVSGEGKKVDVAMKEIKDILFNNEDMEVSILVSAMTRNRLLTDSGALVKQLQKDVNEVCQPGNSFVRFEELQKGEERESSSILIVKSARMHIAEAEKIVKERIASYDSNLVTMEVDLDLIPVIIGKKGATIKKLRNAGGVGADIEVDKYTGEIKIMADKESQREAMKKVVDDIINDNQILRVPMESSMFPDLFGQTGKSVMTKIRNSGVFVKRDDTDTAVLLRGSIEKITDAAEDVRQFIASNQFILFPCDPVDESFLSRRTALLKKIEKEHKVKLSMSRSEQGGVIIRGKNDCIASAEKELKKILFGGDGFSVAKLFVPGSIMGAIIGKGGKNITKYETDHGSLMVNVHSLSNCLSIRGPSDQVETCKGVISKDITDCNVTESVQIDSAAYEKLSKAGVPKLAGGLPVNINLNEATVRMRGAFVDVQEVKLNVNDIISGIYKSCILLTPENFSQVSKLMESNSSQFKEISEPNGISISLDNSLGSIVVEGKRALVKRAKTLLFGLLETQLPSTFAKTKFLKPLLKSMGSSKDVSTMALNSKCSISLNRDLCTFIVQASSFEKLQCGLKAINDKIEAIMKLSYVASVESWLIQSLITKNSQDVEKIRNDTECEITLLKADAMISIVGKEEENVAKAKEQVEQIMGQAKKENFFFDLPESSMNMFVGTSGKHMKSMAANFNVTIDRVKKTKSRIRITGKESNVKLATDAVSDWLSKWEKKNGGVTVSINESMVLRLEKDSSIVDEIQRDFGVKIDLNRKNCSATVRGGKVSSLVEASAKLESVLSDAKEDETKENAFKAKGNETVLPQAMLENETVNVEVSTQQEPFKEQFVSNTNAVIEDPVTEMESDSNAKTSNTAVGNLYNLLVSDDVAQQWDSSTVSTKIDSDESPESGVSYCRSASGFHIRL